MGITQPELVVASHSLSLWLDILLTMHVHVDCRERMCVLSCSCYHNCPPVLADVFLRG